MYFVIVKSIGFDEKSTRVLFSGNDLTEDIVALLIRTYGNAANKIQVSMEESEEEE